jgi:hypothetical protein
LQEIKKSSKPAVKSERIFFMFVVFWLIDESNEGGSTGAEVFEDPVFRRTNLIN